MNNDNFTVLVSGGGKCHWVSMCTVWLLHKMTKWEEQWICIKFCIKLEHSSTETVQMIQKAAAMGNWWLEASSWQCTCSCIMSRAVFWWNIKSPRWLSPATTQICALWPLAFPKTKITFEREEISDCRWFRKIQLVSWWWLGELCEVPRSLLWRGLRHHCPMYSVSCILHLLWLLHGCICSGQTLYFITVLT